MRLGVDRDAIGVDDEIARTVDLLVDRTAEGDRVAVATRDDHAFAVLAAAVRRAARVLRPVDPRPAPDLPGDASLAFVDAPALPGTIGIEAPPGESLLARVLGRKSPPVHTFPGLLRGRPAAAPIPAAPTDVALELPAARWTHASVDDVLASFRARFQVDDGARVLNLAPAWDPHGVLLGPILCDSTDAALYRLPRGATLDVQHAVNFVYRQRCSHLVAPPAVLALLPRLAEDLHPVFGEGSFRALVCAGALDDGLRRRVEAATGRPVHESGLHVVDEGAATPVLAVTAGDTVEERVLAVATAVFKQPAGRLGLGARIETVPGWDSMGQLALVEALEAEFGVRIGLHDMMRIVSLADALRVVEALGGG